MDFCLLCFCGAGLADLWSAHTADGDMPLPRPSRAAGEHVLGIHQSLLRSGFLSEISGNARHLINWSGGQQQEQLTSRTDMDASHLHIEVMQSVCTCNINSTTALIQHHESVTHTIFGCPLCSSCCPMGPRAIALLPTCPIPPAI